MSDPVFTGPCLSDSSTIDESRVMSLNISYTRKATKMDSACPFGKWEIVFDILPGLFLLSNENSKL